jgi:hypothetical protein
MKDAVTLYALIKKGNENLVLVKTLGNLHDAQ